MNAIKLSVPFMALCLLSCSGEKAETTEVTNGNIFVVYKDGNRKQITNKACDESPLLISSRNVVVFVRRSHNKFEATREIMEANIGSLEEKVISREKPYIDIINNTRAIIRVDAPTLSPDEKYLYFMTEKFVNGNLLVRLNLDNGKWQQLFAAQSYQPVNTSQYPDCFIISQSVLGEHGPALHYKLVDFAGNELRPFKNEISAIAFYNNLNAD